MIEITPKITLQDDEIELQFTRASGPGGQNVNKVATAVQLRFDVVNSPSLPENVRARLVELAGKRLTSAGVLVIKAQGQRTQEGNRQEALERLVNLIRQAAVEPKTRKKTKPTRASQERRLNRKRRRSEIKRSRQKPQELE